MLAGAFAQDHAPAIAPGGNEAGNRAHAPSSPAIDIVPGEDGGSIRFVIDGKVVARLDAAGFHVRESIDYGGTLTDISDFRLKTDIRRLPTQTDNIAALKPVAFSMAADPSGRTEYGLIAQQVEPVYPALVETRTDGVKALNYTGLIAPLIAAVQELQADNAALRARIEVLEAANGKAGTEAR